MAGEWRASQHAQAPLTPWSKGLQAATSIGLWERAPSAVTSHQEALAVVTVPSKEVQLFGS